MTNAAKWKEFLEWWENYSLGISSYQNHSIIDRVDKKIEELQKGSNAKQ